MKRLKTIFLGNSPLCFKALINVSDVKAVFTRAIHDDENIHEVIKIAKEHGIPVYTPKTMKLEKDKMAYETIKDIAPDMTISFGYHLIVPKEIIELPKFGTINLHGSLLPKYRGQHVLQWQIINGEKESGVTAHFMSPGIDEGEIILQNKFPITNDDTSIEVLDKMHKMGSEMITEIVNIVSSGKTLNAHKQDDSQASYYKKRTPEDGSIDFQKNSFEIYNLVRALCKPWPGAYFYVENHSDKEKVEVDKIKILETNNLSAGKIIKQKEKTFIAGTKDFDIEILSRN